MDDLDVGAIERELAARRAAPDLEATGFELDVRRTADESRRECGAEPTRTDYPALTEVLDGAPLLSDKRIRVLRLVLDERELTRLSPHRRAAR